MHTKDLLAHALRDAKLDAMADLAATGYYHDFMSPLDNPAIVLASDLARVGTPEAMAIRKRHLNGEFDANKEESDAWADSEEGKAAFNSLMRPGS